jgi:hypothetical protein
MVAADADAREAADSGRREPAGGHRVEAMPWMRERRRFLRAHRGEEGDGRRERRRW